MLRRVGIVVCLLGGFVASAAWAQSADQPSDEELWAGADARIEQHRKADATIVVVDAAGKPLPGAKVEVQQTRHAFLFGCNIFSWGRLPDEKTERAYRQRFAELLNYATLPFYWWSYERRQGEPNHKQAEEVARWCQQHGIPTKGHPLAWNHTDARWLPADADELHRLQLARIDDCVKRFAGLIDRWDVVNEATLYDRPEVLKNAPKYTAMWKKVGQIEFIRECFAHARAANPQATLVINDYCTDPRYERLIEQLVDPEGKRLYDVIGIQSHMHGGAWPTAPHLADLPAVRRARRAAALHRDDDPVGRAGSGRSRATGRPRPRARPTRPEKVVRFYTLLFSHPAVEAITWWDFSDYRGMAARPGRPAAQRHDAQAGLRRAEEAHQGQVVDHGRAANRRGRHGRLPRLPRRLPDHGPRGRGSRRPSRTLR